jgi:hypothetical protein
MHERSISGAMPPLRIGFTEVESATIRRFPSVRYRLPFLSLGVICPILIFPFQLEETNGKA